MKYLVMECHASYAVLLDEEGRFVKAANLHYETGQTVENPVLMKEPSSSKKKKVRGIIRIAAAAACFFLVFNSYYQSYMLPDTAIYLTINPSVCMELNRKGNVVRLTGTNEDGKMLLDGYKRSSNDRLVVTDELIGRAIEMGFLSEGGRVVIDIDAPDEIHFQKYGVELRTNLTEYLERQLTVDIEIIEHGSEVPEDTDSGSEQAESSRQPEKSQEPVPASEGAQEPVSAQPPEGAQEPALEQPSEAPKEQAPVQPVQEPASEGDSGYTDYGVSDYDSSGYSEYEESGYSDYSGYDSSDYE